MTSFVQDMGVDHCCANVFVAKKFLDGADIIASLKQMCGKRVAEGVATNVLDYTCIADGFLDRLLKNRLVDMMPPFFTGNCVLPSVFLREDPLPAPFLRRIGIFAVERIGHLNLSPTFGQEGVDFRLSHFRRVTNLMKEYEPLDPMTIGLFRAAAVMTRAEGFPKTVHEFWLPVRF